VSALLHELNCPSHEGRECICPSVISPLALIGGWPEHRDHAAGLPVFQPVIGHGCRINAFVTIDAGTARPTRIGDNVLLMTKAHIAHDCDIGDDCEVASGAVLGGWVELGQGVKVGLNATIRPRIKVGAGARVGAGAVVVKDVPDGVTVVGNPAHPIGVDPMWNAWYEASRTAA
jgi:acyl-[acyl carrier protein]--UDP-N-acetylglucosamine O-acyltransferase